MTKPEKKPGPDSHDFDWVKAIEECSVESALALLQSFIQKNVEDRNKSLEECSLEFKVISNKEFSVARINTDYTKVITFVAVEKSIKVLNGNERTLFDFKLMLDENCECRFIDTKEKKELLRWQVARKALEELFLFVN